MGNRIRAALVGVAALLGWATSAFANGRYPFSQRLVEHPTDPNQLVLSASYGLVATRDRGASWYHICESSFAYSAGYLGDPLLDFTGDQNLIVGVQSSINVSTDQGCDWVKTLEEGNLIVDHALARSQPGRIVAAVAIGAGATMSHELRESSDHGRTWTPIGTPLPVTLLYSIDVDPTNPEHFYATGLDQDAGRFVTSEDHGASWKVFPMTGTSSKNGPYIAGIDPRDPKKIYVRTDRTEDLWTEPNALLYSEDGGATFREIHRSNARLLGFALSPDASTVLIGYGDPVVPGSRILPGPFGVFMSPTDKFSFEQVHGGHVNCLTWTKTGVYVCSMQSRDQYELAFSPVADFRADGGCLVPLLRTRDIKGPLACPDRTTTAICASEWPNNCAKLGACSSSDPPSQACIPFDPPPDPNASTGSGAGGASTAAGPGGAAGEGDPDAKGGCGCRSTPAQGRTPATTPLFFLAALVLRWQRRAGSRREARYGLMARSSNS